MADKSSNDLRRLEVIKAVNQFLKDNPDRHAEVMRLANATPRYTKAFVLTDMEDFEVRMKRICQMQREVPLLQAELITNTHLAALLVMPLDKLMNTPSEELWVYTQGIPALIRHFLHPFQGKESSGRAGSEASSARSTPYDRRKFEDISEDTIGPSSAATQAKKGLKEGGRDLKEAKAAADKDGNLCVVTGSMISQGCHIVPFSWTSTLSNCANTVSALNQGDLCDFVDLHPITDRDPFRMLRSTVLSGIASLDQSWNMVTLKVSLREYWNKAYMGLRYYSHMRNKNDPEKTDVSVQFHWLGKSSVKPDGIPNLHDTQRRALLDDIDLLPVELREYECESGRAVNSGLTFTVTMNNEDANSFIMVLQLQWAMIRIAALSGGGQWPELLPSPNGYFGYGGAGQAIYDSEDVEESSDLSDSEDVGDVDVEEHRGRSRIPQALTVEPLPYRPPPPISLRFPAPSSQTPATLEDITDKPHGTLKN